MKKFVSLGLASVLALSMAAPVFAADATKVDQSSEDKTSKIDMKYTTEATWEVTIPVTVEFSSTKLEDTQDLVASNVLIANGETLKVTVSSENDWKMKKNNSAISYTLEFGDDTSYGTTADNSTNSTLLSVGAKTTGEGVNDKAVKLKFSTTASNVEKATEAGEHKDQLTFTCGVQ